ncbi:MAG TPA: hypothetical protein VFJ99_02755 [Solirubrobacterales bacterium]|nr:hypothetical protein [Solirubrobacterales bacterium]
MEASENAEDFVAAGLASLGIAADDVELAVARAAHELFWPPIQELLDLDTSAAPIDRAPDLSQAPPR